MKKEKDFSTKKRLFNGILITTVLLTLIFIQLIEIVVT